MRNSTRNFSFVQKSKTLKFHRLLSVFFLFNCLFNYSKAQIQCPDDALHLYNMANDPQYSQAHASKGVAFQQWMLQGGGNQNFIIPVVVHIVHNNGPENIPDAQVIDAIQELNQWYGTGFGLETETWTDPHIEFRLAHLDPEGNCTSGITRTQVDYPVTMNGSDSCDPDAYT